MTMNTDELANFHAFHDAVDAALSELDDRGLLNGVDEDLHQEIGNHVVNRVHAALSARIEAGKGDVDDGQVNRAFATLSPQQRVFVSWGDVRAALEAARSVSPEPVVMALIQSALDLLQEKKYGSPARSPGHNAQLELKAALAALSALHAPAPMPDVEGEE